MKTSCWALVLRVALFSATSLAVDDPPAGDVVVGDLAALQGRWKVWVTAEHCMRFEVRGRAFTLSHEAGDQASEPWTGSLVIDERAAPKRLTWRHVQTAGRELPDNQCIYELHGDTWLLIGGGAAAAPEHFYSGGGKGSQTLVFKRDVPK